MSGPAEGAWPIRIAVRIDFSDGAEHTYQVLGEEAAPAPLGGFWPEGVVTRDVAKRMEYDLLRQRELDRLRRLLRFAADDDELDIGSLGYAVITAGTMKIPGAGRMAGQVVELDEVDYRGFGKGEILVLGEEGGREPFGRGRKPGKYDVVCEWFGQGWEAAVRRSAEVKAAPARDGFTP